MTVPTKSPFKAGVFSSVSTVTGASYVVTDTDGFDTILFSTGASNRTLTLPAIAASAGRRLTIKKTDSGAGTVTITPNGGTIDGAGSFTLTAQYNDTQIVSDGSNWSVQGATQASAIQSGLISTIAQTLAGLKTFNSGIRAETSFQSRSGSSDGYAIIKTFNATIANGATSGILTVGGGGGILICFGNNTGNGNINTRKVVHTSSFGNGVVTELSNQNGITGGFSYTVSQDGSGGMSITNNGGNTGGFGGLYIGF